MLATHSECCTVSAVLYFLQWYSGTMRSSSQDIRKSKKHIPTASAIKQKHHRKHIPTTAIGISFSDKNLSDLRPSELLQYTQPVDRLLTLVHACVQSQIEYLTVPFTRGGAQARIPGSRPLCSCGEMSQMIEQSRNVAVSLPSFFGPWDQRRELGVIS